MFTEEQEICEAGPEELEEIARRFGFSKGKVKSMLFRLREKLASRLSEEGLIDGR